MRRARFLLWLAALAVGASFCVVVIDQRELAFRTLLRRAEQEAFGVSLNRPILDEPGLYLRIPFLHQVYRYDKRRLRFDSRPQSASTSEKEPMIVDYYAVWRIADPRLFFESFPGGIEYAVSRIDNTTYNKLRNTLSTYSLSDLLSERRERIQAGVTRASDEELSQVGIEVLDLRVRGLDYPEHNLDHVYRRMRTERERFGLRARAEGTEKSRAIRSKADEESRILVAEAERRATRLHGEGDAEAARIYAEAYGKDPEFFAFMRSLEAYRKALNSQTTLILSPDLPFLRYLFEADAPEGAAAPPAEATP